MCCFATWQSPPTAECSISTMTGFDFVGLVTKLHDRSSLLVIGSVVTASRSFFDILASVCYRGSHRGIQKPPGPKVQSLSRVVSVLMPARWTGTLSIWFCPKRRMSTYLSLIDLLLLDALIRQDGRDRLASQGHHIAALRAMGKAPATHWDAESP